LRQSYHINNLYTVFNYYFIVMFNKKVSVYPNYSETAFLIKGDLPHPRISGSDFNCSKPHFSGSLHSMVYKQFTDPFALMLLVDCYIH